MIKVQNHSYVDGLIKHFSHVSVKDKRYTGRQSPDGEHEVEEVDTWIIFLDTQNPNTGEMVSLSKLVYEDEANFKKDLEILHQKVK